MFAVIDMLITLIWPLYKVNVYPNITLSSITLYSYISLKNTLV